MIFYLPNENSPGTLFISLESNKTMPSLRYLTQHCAAIFKGIDEGGTLEAGEGSMSRFSR